jgi:FKBP-type peptidyl-prolyl cis-trans isomerase
MTTPEAAGPMPSGSSALEKGSDPICGTEYRWTGGKCSREGAEDPVKKGGKLELVDSVTGTGPDARPGDAVSVHYVGTLDDGTKFDSSRDAGHPLDFKIGMGQVIKGFERGIVGMKVGGVRKITIPPDLGYGRRGQPPVIPPNATLHFEVELMAIK